MQNFERVSSSSRFTCSEFSSELTFENLYLPCLQLASTHGNVRRVVVNILDNKREGVVTFDEPGMADNARRKVDNHLYIYTCIFCIFTETYVYICIDTYIYMYIYILAYICI